MTSHFWKGSILVPKSSLQITPNFLPWNVLRGDIATSSCPICMKTIQIEYIWGLSTENLFNSSHLSLSSFQRFLCNHIKNFWMNYSSKTSQTVYAKFRTRLYIIWWLLSILNLTDVSLCSLNNVCGTIWNNNFVSHNLDKWMENKVASLLYSDWSQV